MLKNQKKFALLKLNLNKINFNSLIYVFLLLIIILINLFCLLSLIINLLYLVIPVIINYTEIKVLINTIFNLLGTAILFLNYSLSKYNINLNLYYQFLYMNEIEIEDINLKDNNDENNKQLDSIFNMGCRISKRQDSDLDENSCLIDRNDPNFNRRSAYYVPIVDVVVEERVESIDTTNQNASTSATPIASTSTPIQKEVRFNSISEVLSFDKYKTIDNDERIPVQEELIDNEKWRNSLFNKPK